MRARGRRGPTGTGEHRRVIPLGWVDAEAAICVDAGTGELTVSMEDAEDPTVLVCG